MRHLIGNWALMEAVLILALVTLCSMVCGVDKCCRYGDVLVLNDIGNFECIKTRPKMQTLIELRENNSRGLPTCGDSGHLMQRLLEDSRDTDTDLPANSCLDVFYDSASTQDFPVLVCCSSPVTMSSYDHQSQDAMIADLYQNLPTPRILNFRKCCPGPYSYYDPDLRHCVDGAASLRALFERFVELDFIDALNGPPNCQYAILDYKVSLDDVYSDGPLVSITITGHDGIKQNLTIDMDNACLDAGLTSTNFIAARVCSDADYCLVNPCIRKCCPEDKINNKCKEPPAANLSLVNFRTALANVAANSTATPILDLKSYGLLIGKPCDLYYSAEPDEFWEIGTRGELLLNDNLIFNHFNSCMEYIYNDPNFENGIHPFYCFDDDEYKNPITVRSKIIAGLALTSCGFLLVTLLVYICLPTLQNLHGKTLMCHVFSLLIAYAFLATAEIITTRLDHIGDDFVADALCKFIGYAILFWFYAVFFWLNVMCFDIWWTFGGIQRVSTAAAKRRQQRNRFLTYCAYAWGMALLLTGLSAIFEHLGVFESMIGRERCWFDSVSQSIAEVVFFIVPVTVTLFINTAFFIITSYRCSKVKAEIKRVMANVKDPSTRKFHSDRTRLIMNLKLFVVMGIPWLLENIPAYLNHYNQLPIWIQELFYVADVINSLQGLWIFILFVLKPKVYRALCKRFGSTAGLHNKSSNTLNVQDNIHRVRKSASNSTIMSNFIVSSTVT